MQAQVICVRSYVTQLLKEKTMAEFLARVKALVVGLSSIRDPISPHEHLEVLLHGLPHYYKSVVTLISSKSIRLKVPNVGVLLAHEAQMIDYGQGQGIQEVIS
uniref:Retrovirus-related Pol polyprotein from transposon TNT 1-94 n=1 Tax=Cajanus cajan TaxID=3821 RepID=A0A151S4J1_CAJCA|nr:hypothetical protein KK1_028498 [Cajanus cajan]